MNKGIMRIYGIILPVKYLLDPVYKDLYVFENLN